MQSCFVNFFVLPINLGGEHGTVLCVRVRVRVSLG